MNVFAFRDDDDDEYRVIDCLSRCPVEPPRDDQEEVVLENCVAHEGGFFGRLVPTEMVPRNGWIELYYDDDYLDDLTGEPVDTARFVEVCPTTIRAIR